METEATINSVVTSGGTINSTVVTGSTISSTITAGGVGPAGPTGATGPTGPPGSLAASVYNVKDYGALGNGIHDDTVAIQAAINAANTGGGGTVQFPAGTYIISSTLTLYRYVSILGAGQQTSIISQTSTTAGGFVGVDVSSLTISDITITGPASGSGQGIDLSWSLAGNVPFITMRNILVRYFGGDGIRIMTPIVSHFENVVSEFNDVYGFNWYQAGTSCTFVNCWARQNGEAGYRFNQSVYVALTGCAADNNGIGYLVDSAQSIGFFACGCEGSLLNGGSWNGINWKITNSSIIGLYSCWITDNRNLGVWVTGGSQAIHLNVADNTPHAGAVNFITVDSGCNAVIEDLHNTTANSLAAGTTTVINDGAGGMSMVGALTLAADPTLSLQAATKQYVDNSVGSGTTKAFVVAMATAL